MVLSIILWNSTGENFIIHFPSMEFTLHSIRKIMVSMDGKFVKAQAEPLTWAIKIENSTCSIDGTIVYFPSIEFFTNQSRFLYPSRIEDAEIFLEAWSTIRMEDKEGVKNDALA